MQPLSRVREGTTMTREEMLKLYPPNLGVMSPGIPEFFERLDKTIMKNWLRQEYKHKLVGPDDLG